MIVDAPTPAEFHAAGLNQLALAWQIAVGAVHDYDTALAFGAEADTETSAEYWRRTQPALANAYSLVQQGMELALKGRIASVSPFLLIGDPSNWPGRAAIEDVSFGDLRTLDAADLVKVHNGVRADRLDEAFRTFWDEVRRERNKIMHSVAPRAFDPATLVRTILTAAGALYADLRWPQRLLDMEEDGRLAAFGFNDDAQNSVMRQIDDAIRHLQPAEAKRSFGYDKGRRGYLCPRRYYAANRDWQESWPHLAQLTSREAGDNALHCCLCDETTTVERQPCVRTECKGDVIADNLCLTCISSQDESDMEADYQFILVSLDLKHPFCGEPSVERCRGDEAAKRFGRDMLLLDIFNAVSISRLRPDTHPDADRQGRVHGPRDLAVGAWRRAGADLDWLDRASVDDLLFEARKTNVVGDPREAEPSVS